MTLSGAWFGEDNDIVWLVGGACMSIAVAC